MRNLKKTILLSCVLAVAALVGVGGSLAWLSRDRQASNNFTVGLVNIGIVEGGQPIEGGTNDYPGITAGATVDKPVQIRNIDTDGRAIPVYIRARVVPVWRYEDGGSAAAAIDLALNGKTAGWSELQSDGYYYHKGAVAPDTATSLLMQSVTLHSPVPAGAYLEVQVLADAVQAEGDAAAEAWGDSAAGLVRPGI